MPNSVSFVGPILHPPPTFVCVSIAEPVVIVL